MRIKSVAVANYGCISNAEIVCESLTALVGANGAGELIVLPAIESFYSTSPEPGEEDFYNRNILSPIDITVTFTDLDKDA